MSKIQDIAVGRPGQGLRGLRFSRDWITRPVFAVVLAGAVVAAIFGDRPYLEIVVAVSVLGAAREWHRMVGKGRFGPELAVTTATVWSSLIAFVLLPPSPAPWAILGAGTLVVLALSIRRHSNPLWQASAVLYLGIPSLAVITLRDVPAHGAWVIIGLFIVVWATDTGALVVGNLAGGPKLAPALSPNKTWSGTIGGILAAAAAEAVLIYLLGGQAWAAALFGAGLGSVAHLGDLFESWVKRQFGIKDSGSIIPGHGGVLDRIDSTLAAAVALQLAVLVFHLDPLFGGRP